MQSSQKKRFVWSTLLPAPYHQPFSIRRAKLGCQRSEEGGNKELYLPFAYHLPPIEHSDTTTVNCPFLVTKYLNVITLKFPTK